MILRGEIAPGRRVIEVHLTQALHTSRSTLREALRLLEGRGLVVANHSGGMRVVELDEERLVDTLHTRAALEELSAAAAARRRRDGELGDEALRELGVLADAVAAPMRSPTAESAVLADRNLHLAISRLAGNRPCHEILDRLWDLLVLAATWSAEPAGRSQGHGDLLAAIRDGDEETAAGLARRHALVASVSGASAGA